MVYLDYTANTPAEEAVLDCFCQTERSFIGNANSAHEAGSRAAARQSEITASIARMLNAAPDEIIYTSGATESNNLAVRGTARALRHRGKHILTTPLEHSSVSAPLTALQEQGWEVEMVKLGRDGKLDLEDLTSLLRQDTVLLTVCAVDSELGVVQPVQEIREILKDFPNCRLHVDATQAIGKLPFDCRLADTLSLTAHKFYGLNGSGLLLKRRGLALEPIIYGGASTTVYRSGTPTLALNASLEKALSLALHAMEERREKVTAYHRFLREKLSSYPLVRINSPKDAIPHILNLSVQGVKGAEFQKALSARGVYVSVKAACSSDSLPSRAVFAVSRDRKNALCSWRISLSHRTTEQELAEFLTIFDTCYKELTGEK